MKITVLGSGGWGTALALLLLENGHEVTLWSYTREESAVLRDTHENPMLKGVVLPGGAEADLGHVCGAGLRRGGDCNPLLRGAVHGPEAAGAGRAGHGADFGIQGH